MRKISWMVVMLMTGVLIGIGATSAFAAEPTGPTSGNTTLQQMQQACVNGDFSAMQQLTNGYCGAAGNGAGDATGGWAGGCGGGGLAPADGSNTTTITSFRRGMMGGRATY